MAGFGIFMELLFSAGLGLLIATALALTLVHWGGRVVSVASPHRRAFLLRCGVQPFLGLLWVLFSFILYSYCIEALFHRDNRLSTNPHTPLPDGFIIGSVDYHTGYIIRPGTRMDEFPHDSPACVASVLELQIADPYLLGSKFIWPSTTKAYFLLDTRSGKIRRFDEFEEVKGAAAAMGIETNFNEFGGYSLMEAYVQYRPIWFDWFFPVMSVVGLSWMFGSLAVRAKKLRRESAGSVEAHKNCET
jgi:hypothetical protein